MSIFLSVALAAATQFQPVCSWDRPGANPYTGSTSAAIERYTDIPEQVRKTLKRRMEEHQSDDQVIITRDAIVGKNQYEATIRDMHFGAASVCTSVTRSKWSERRQEPAAVYCVGEHCILVPRICGNVSRITRLPGTRTARTTPPAAPASAERVLGDSLNARDLGLADAPPLEEIPLDEAARLERERDRAYAQVAEVLDAAAQADKAQASNDFGDRDGQYGRRPYWPKDNPDNSGPTLPATPVPEADSWAMLLAGLAVLGYAVRRRQRRS
ncbi:MHFG family PEP-CTERM protein [Pseudoduganella danionis]|uniref:PEP-CTERM sorting domain-containing protein n=1 Tax=Pseudoduganella danionis TaxID=1890295 RepID=A0ABW9SQR6_9BURK|nr:MHFG family PEP-CTERM protein [Pseudoduganella danionis]MTW33964.1 PEP-CTERM sorting domain-containing protein [Pseudoduganella danionis]